MLHQRLVDPTEFIFRARRLVIVDADNRLDRCARVRTNPGVSRGGNAVRVPENAVPAVG